MSTYKWNCLLKIKELSGIDIKAQGLFAIEYIKSIKPLLF